MYNRLSVSSLLSSSSYDCLLLQESGKEFSLTSLIKAAEANIEQNDKRLTDTRVHLPTNDITLMHSAVPFLPLPTAIFCAVINVLIPGLGISNYILLKNFFFLKSYLIHLK